MNDDEQWQKALENVANAKRIESERIEKERQAFVNRFDLPEVIEVTPKKKPATRKLRG